MSVFTDSTGRQWVITLTHGLIKRIKSRFGLDLYAGLKSPETLAEIAFGDPENFPQLMHGLCEQQIKERNLSEEEFDLLLDGATIEKSTEAFLEAVADFSPRSRVGAAAKGMLTKALSKMDDKIIARMEKSITDTGLSS